nr:hypothetical protein [Bacteroidales bacterium]
FDRLFKKKIESAPEHVCAACHSQMNPFPKFSFTEVQKKEQEIKSVKYKPYICTCGHVTVLKDKLSNAFGLCPHCNGMTERKIKSQVIQKSTYTEKGLMESEYRCEFCGATRTVQEKIPLLYRSYSSSGGSSSYSSSSSRSSSSHRSSSSRGSFGGGRSGGGGYKGKW